MTVVFSTWIGKFKNFSKHPPILKAQTLLDRIPGRPIRLARFFLLELNSAPKKNMRGFGVVRPGGPQDIAGMCLLENKEQTFRQWFDAGENCVVALDGAKVVGYTWYSTGPFHIENRFNFKIDINKDSVYSFDCFIKSEYRLRGIWVILQKHILDSCRELGRDKVIALVDYGNNSSLKAHLRLGYVVSRQITVLATPMKSYFLHKEFDCRTFDPQQVLV